MRLIPPSTVEQHYGIPTTELRRWRTTGVGPEYFQLTPKTVRYLDDYLHDWFNNPANLPAGEFQRTGRTMPPHQSDARAAHRVGGWRT